MLFLSGITFLNGCIKGDLDQPPINIPRVDFSSNMTIAGLQTFFADSMHSAYGQITKDIIIQGKVISSDQTGNIYKTIYLQDTTGGIVVELNSTTLYVTYKIGQRLYIKCKGMYITNYNGVIEIGASYNGSVGQLQSTDFNTYLFKDSFPGNPYNPKIITIPEFSTPLVCTLVQIDSIQFSSTDAGQPYSSLTATTNHTIQDNHGNSFILRTSNYASFATILTPTGTGSIVGVLSIYGGTWQLYIRDLNDVKGFH